MPILGVHLERFRGFVDAKIELKALTVLLGPNSAGKSSFLQSLAALAQAQRRNENPLTLDAHRGEAVPSALWPIDLGTANELRTRGTTEPIIIRLTTSSGIVTTEYAGTGASGLELSAVESQSVGVPSEPIEASTVQLSSAEASAATPHATNSLRRETKNAWKDAHDRVVEVVWRGLEPTAAVLKATRSVVRLEMSQVAQLASDLRTLTYLGAIRQAPLRKYARPERSFDGVGPSGEFTAEFLLSNGHRRVDHVSPPGVPTSRASVRLDESWVTSDSTIHDVTAFWLAHLELADEVLVAESDDHLTVKVKVKPPGAKDARALPDLGFGVSQVLPVIVAGLHLSGDALYVVELPEAQLHPFAQARLADFFCALVKRGGRVLIETHSEALFHRLRLRAALDRELASKTAIWFIDRPGPDGLCMQPKQVRLDDELHWPEGFLSDALNEELLMRHVRAARAQSAPADENEKPTP